MGTNLLFRPGWVIARPCDLDASANEPWGVPSLRKAIYTSLNEVYDQLKYIISRFWCRVLALGHAVYFFLMSYFSIKIDSLHFCISNENLFFLV
jgi:hypothetical protein